MTARPLSGLIVELRRRRVFRVVVAYLGASFVILQLADLLAEPLNAPTWTMQGVLAVLAVGLPVAVVLGWYFQASLVIERDQKAVASSTASSAPAVLNATSDPMRVAVLPFRLLREDTEIEFLGIALADAIAGSLTGIRTLQVRSPLRIPGWSRTDVDHQSEVDPDVDAVLHGTILRAGTLLRIQVQLARTADGAMLWSESSNYPLDDLIALQDEVAHRVVASLGVGLTSSERSRLRSQLPDNSRAFELFLRANHTSLRDFGWAEARDLYRESLALDPDFAPAWARLARAYRMLAKYDSAGSEGDDNLRLARGALDEALRRDPDLPLAHNLYAQLEVELGRPVDASARLLARIRLGVNDAELFAGLVHSCRYCGLLDESIAAHHRARELDAYIPTSITHTFFMAGRYEDALAALGSSHTEYSQCLTLAMLGRNDEALRIAHGYPAADRAAKRPFLASLIDLIEGRYQESAAKLASLGQMSHDAEALYYSARHYGFMNMQEHALETMRAAVDHGYYAIDVYQNDPWLDSLRESSEFARIRQEAEKRRSLSAQTLFAAGLREVF